MEPKELTSLQHPIVKHLVKLRVDNHYRKGCASALVVGKKLVQELSRKNIFKRVFIEKTAPLPHFQTEELYRVTPEILKKITGLKVPEPMAAEIPLPQPANLAEKKFILGLNGINDPGNLGTLLRTALALNWEGAFITEKTVDPFNEKALRAAKGATFELPLCFGTLEQLIALAHRNQWHLCGADMKGIPLEKCHIKTPLLLLMGNESHGIEKNLKSSIELISIPMNPEMESLNVSIAGAILMYNLRQTAP